MWTEARSLAVVACLSAGPALAEGPLGAIDWIEDELRLRPAPGPAEPPVTGGMGVESIQVSPIDAPSADAAGLLPPNVTGLPRDLWAGSSTETLVQRIGQIDPGLTPAIRDLVFTLLLAELDPPADGAQGGALLEARLDRLWAFGALMQLQALVERAGIESRAVFARYLDATLLTGTEGRACALLLARPELTQDIPTRVFCLARGGDWAAAALTLQGAEALGLVTPAEDTLLLRYLDAELAEQELLPAGLPQTPSPLLFRISEAVGDPLTTERLPLAYAHADLRSNNGWRAQIEAAERLARTGAVQPNRLLGLYTERRPAASGGVWDRVAAVQALEAALDTNDPAAVGPALWAAWRALDRVGLVPVLAELYAPRLAGLALAPREAGLALRLGLLTDAYETAARAHAPGTDTEAFLAALAAGNPGRARAPDDRARAIQAGFEAGAAPPGLAAEIGSRRLGEVILRTIARFEAGAAGDPAALAEAVATLRAIGLEAVARRAALDLMILGAR